MKLEKQHKDLSDVLLDAAKFSVGGSVRHVRMNHDEKHANPGFARWALTLLTWPAGASSSLRWTAQSLP